MIYVKKPNGEEFIAFMSTALPCNGICYLPLQVFINIVEPIAFGEKSIIPTIEVPTMDPIWYGMNFYTSHTKNILFI
jgi:hypothetical protein